MHWLTWVVDNMRECFLKPLLWLAYKMNGYKISEKSLVIVGDKKFCERFKYAIDFLRQKKCSEVKDVDLFLRYILQSPRFVLRYSRTGTILAFEKEIVDESDEWLACLLAYYAFRAKLFYSYKEKHKQSGGVGKSGYAPDKAYDVMFDCLTKVGGTYEELKHLNEFIEKEKAKI